MSKRLLDRLCVVYKPRINNYFIVRSARTWITNKQSHVYMSHKPVLGKISDDATAKDFVYTLLPSERQLLYEELKKTMEQKENAQGQIMKGRGHRCKQIHVSTIVLLKMFDFEETCIFFSFFFRFSISSYNCSVINR